MTAPARGGGKAVPHCWEDRGNWIMETYGYNSPEHLAYYADEIPSATCMLLDGHDGPHEWTDDSEIEVQFEPLRERPEEDPT